MNLYRRSATTTTPSLLKPMRLIMALSLGKTKQSWFWVAFLRQWCYGSNFDKTETQY